VSSKIFKAHRGTSWITVSSRTYFTLIQSLYTGSSYFSNYFFVIPDNYWTYINIDAVNALETDSDQFPDESITNQKITINMKMQSSATIYRETIHTISKIISKVGGFASGLIILVNLLFISFVKNNFKRDIALTMIEDGEELSKN